MQSQLSAVCAEYESASARLQQLATRVSDSDWSKRADPARWSVGECVAHLNLTARAFLPLIDAALVAARDVRDRGTSTPGRYRRDFVGWLLWRTTGPPARFKIRTTAPFVPQGVTSKDAIVAEFDELQAAHVERVRSADGLPIHRVKVRSPFDPRMQYNLYACFTVLPRHQHRHLWQAERVWDVSGRSA